MLKKKIKKPIKRIAVYQYVARLANSSDAPMIAEVAILEKDGAARSELAKIADSLMPRSQTSTRRRL
jgi:hypothetical protein